MSNNPSSSLNIIPEVQVLQAISPSIASAREDSLEYQNLSQAVQGEFVTDAATSQKHWNHGPASVKYEYPRMHRFWDAEPDSLAEHEAASSLAKQYLILGSYALNQAIQDDAKQLLSKRFTDSASELYGVPDAVLAKKLYMERLHGFEPEPIFKEAAQATADYLHSTYEPVFNALNISQSPELLSPNDVADRFEAALGVLALDFDSAWSEWLINRDQNKDSLSVVASKKQIIVGMKRASMPKCDLKAKFSHEVLVHAQRSINGAKFSPELATGLPGYLDAEEGLGAFVEYAINGNVPQIYVDRYIDIAYALGQIDGQQHSRAELLAIAYQRAVARNELLDNPKTNEDIQKEVYAHVNRIYRGSLGNEYIGIFTKDASYQTGFIKNGQFISEQLAQGKSSHDVMRYMLSGKFDPTNSLHTAFIARH